MKHKTDTDTEQTQAQDRAQKKEAPGRKSAVKAKTSKATAKAHRKTSPK